MKIRSLIKGLIKVPARDLCPNPMNWRSHPEEQLDVLRGLFAEIGFTTPVLVREQADGTYQLIDGHARVEMLPPDHEVDCILLDCDAETALKILATHDPVSAMAGKDEQLLQELLNQVEFVNPATQQMLDALLEHGQEAEEAIAEEGTGQPETIKEKFQILIDFESEALQGEWLEKLVSMGLKCRSLIT